MSRSNDPRLKPAGFFARNPGSLSKVQEPFLDRPDMTLRPRERPKQERNRFLTPFLSPRPVLGEQGDAIRLRPVSQGIANLVGQGAVSRTG